MKHASLVIADAHQNMLEAVRSLLRDLFEVVVMVADGDSLIRASTALEPDLIIVDLSLAASGAGNALQSLRFNNSLPATRIIALSIHDETEAVREAFAAGATGFVLKRAAATDLIPAVSKVLQNHRYVSPGVQAEGRALADNQVNHR